MSNSNDVKIEHEVGEIYKALSLYEEATEPLFEKPSYSHPQSKSIFKRFVLAPTIFFGLFVLLVLGIGWPLEYIKLAFLLLMLFWYVAIPVVQIMEIVADGPEMLRFLRNPNKIVIEALSSVVEGDCELTRSLSTCSIDALKLVKSRLEAHHAAIEVRLGVMVGALAKVGIVPGLITLVLAASSKFESYITVPLAIFVFFLYILAFTVLFSIPRLGLYVKLIQDEIERKSVK
jgi:hypothetical protein